MNDIKILSQGEIELSLSDIEVEEFKKIFVEKNSAPADNNAPSVTDPMKHGKP